MIQSLMIMRPKLTGVLCSGSFICDFIAHNLPKIGEPGDLIYAPEGISLHVGGHAANVAINLVQLQRSDISVVGAIGTDVLGEFLVKELLKKDLKVCSERFPEFHTAKNIALIVEGQDRRFIAELSANTMLTPQHVLGALREFQPEIFYQGTVGGLRYVDREIKALLIEAKAMNALTFVDVVRPYNGSWDSLKDAFDLIDVFHCNKQEVTALTDDDDVLNAIKTLIGKEIGLVLVTLGAEGFIAAWGKNMLKIPTFRVSSIDPTGAGDSFCAGIVDALLTQETKDISSMNMEEAKQIFLRGSAAGAACVTSTGATQAVTKKNVDALIKDQGSEVWAMAKNLYGDLYTTE